MPGKPLRDTKIVQASEFNRHNTKEAYQTRQKQIYGIQSQILHPIGTFSITESAHLKDKVQHTHSIRVLTVQTLHAHALVYVMRPARLEIVFASLNDENQDGYRAAGFFSYWLYYRIVVRRLMSLDIVLNSCLC